MPQTQKVSAVIPNYNGVGLLKKHLPAVLEMLRNNDEVVIVDDKSTDDSVQWLVDHFQLVPAPFHQGEYALFAGERKLNQKKVFIKVVVNEKNQRFAASCNRGVENAEGEYVFLLNSDVSPHADALLHLLPHFKNSSTFAVGCLEIEQHGKEKVIGGKNKLWFERGIFVHSRDHQPTTGPIGWVSGGSGLFNRQKWNELGGFDLRYAPAYWEDIDLSYRARQKGWEVVFEADAVVDHNHETTNQTAFGQRKIDLMSVKNGLKFLWKNGTVKQKLEHFLWLPYHLTITNWRTGGVFGQSFINFLVQN